MKQELIWLTKYDLQSIIDVWDKAYDKKLITRRLSKYIIGNIADIIDILDNYEKYE